MPKYQVTIDLSSITMTVEAESEDDAGDKLWNWISDNFTTQDLLEDTTCDAYEIRLEEDEEVDVK